MNLQPLDKGSYIPLYLQLFDRLVSQIESGELKPGERLISERDLAQALNVSRITARQAIEALLESGLVYREQGRGTFIAEPKMRGVLGFTSFTEDMLSRGMQPTSRVLVQELICVDEKLQSTLKIGPTDYAFHLVRLRCADGQPVAMQSSYMPAQMFPGLEKEDLNNKSLFKVLIEKYYIRPAWTEAEIEAMAASPEEARLLNLKANDPLLVVRGLTFTESFAVVESVRTAYRSKGVALYIGRQRLTSSLGKP
jgi:GntR family transcriptional regulator